MSRLLVTLIALMMSTVAQGASVRDYMMRAIDAGEVSGVIDDATAKAWQQQTGSSAPVSVKIRPVGDFQQPGCKRLEILISQENVTTKDGKKLTLGLPMTMNVCRDGRPPMEGVNLEQIREAMRKNQQK